MTPWYANYWWQWVFQNIVPTYVCLLAGAVIGVVFRNRIMRAWRGLVGERADIEDVKRMADAARRIAADLFEHHTGERHPDAPEHEREGP
jgi:hypothetical protein